MSKMKHIDRESYKSTKELSDEANGVCGICGYKMIPVFAGESTVPDGRLCAQCTGLFQAGTIMQCKEDIVLQCGLYDEIGKRIFTCGERYVFYCIVAKDGRTLFSTRNDLNRNNYCDAEYLNKYFAMDAYKVSASASYGDMARQDMGG